MKEQEFKETLASNLTTFRKKAGLTQSELAEKINYSDKSVSKWERGEGAPEVYVLMSIAKLCGTTVSELIGETKSAPQKSNEKKEKKEKKQISTTSKVIITILSALLVWMLTAIAYFVLHAVGVERINPVIIYLFDIPATFIITTVFAEIWAGPILKYISISALIWSIVFVLQYFLGFTLFKAMIPVAIILEIIFALWFYMRAKAKKAK